MAKFTCPFCLQEYDKKLIKYYCPTCGNTSEASFFESILEFIFGTILGSIPIFEPINVKIKCKHSEEGRKCFGFATNRKCINPNCIAGVDSEGHAVGSDEIPKTAIETPNLPFSIVGVSNSGKTNFITVMLHELDRTPGLRLALGPQNVATKKHQNDFYKLIYEEHQAPNATTPDEVFPQIWFIRNLKRKRGNNVPTYTFTIFDGAGESQEEMDTSSREHNYIKASKAIIITLDPLILEGVRNSGIVDPDVMEKSLAGKRNEYKNANEIVHDVASYIRTAKGVRDNKILSVPIAVVLTKFDTILLHNSFSPDALVKKPSLTVENGVINASEFKQVDDEIRNWLYDIGEGSFIEALSANFKDFCFFGVSSYGAPPSEAGFTSDKIKPHRILDPILWLFKKSGFID